EFSTGQIIDSIYYPPTFVPQEIGLGIVSLWTGSVPDYNYHNDTITEATITNHAWGHCIVKDVDFHTPAATGDHNIQITITDAYGETTTITRSLHVEYCPDNVVQENENPALRLYPNPATDKLHLEIPTLTQTQHAEIYDASGKLVFTQSIRTKTTTLNIRNLKSGNYVLKVNGISKGFTVVR
ncbi:MAG: T9SS type A sorting domain-containing protein, partial [Bacteroidales bacterium]